MDNEHEETTPAIRAIRKARGLMGGTTAFAEALGVKPPTVSEWCTGRRKVPMEQCPKIEHLTLAKGELVPRTKLRPDINWDEFSQPAAA